MTRRQSIHTIEGSQPPLCKLEEGMQTLRVNLAILESVAKRAWQHLQTPPNPHA